MNIIINDVKKIQYKLEQGSKVKKYAFVNQLQVSWSYATKIKLALH